MSGGDHTRTRLVDVQSVRGHVENRAIAHLPEYQITIRHQMATSAVTMLRCGGNVKKMASEGWGTHGWH
jgi:hypothetical protein